MADAEAIRILLERRGSMYDPLIVDTFIAIHTAAAQPDHAVTIAESAFVPGWWIHSSERSFHPTELARKSLRLRALMKSRPALRKRLYSTIWRSAWLVMWIWAMSVT